MVKTILCCATKVTAQLFGRSTLLGRSLRALPEAARPRLVLLPENTGSGALGLSAFYNRVIDQIEDDSSIVGFIHDDVYIHDWNLQSRLVEALSIFDLIGVVGSANVSNGQPGWWHDLDSKGRPQRNDATIRSGVINHFDPCHVRPDWYGVAPLECDLLDGVFLAARVGLLRSSGVRFDPQFKFHCYDSDFCYSARAAGLRLGTWPIALTHASGGVFGQEWVTAARLLQGKWRAK